MEGKPLWTIVCVMTSVYYILAVSHFILHTASLALMQEQHLQW